MEWNLPELLLDDKNFLQTLKSTSCVCCLTKDVQFVYLHTCAHSTLIRILFGNLLKDEDVVCLGCHKVLQNFHMFKLQVEESIKLMSQQIVSLPNIKKLNSLQTTNIDIYNTPNNSTEEEFEHKTDAESILKSEDITCKSERHTNSDTEENLYTDMIEVENPNIDIKQEPSQLKMNIEVLKPKNVKGAQHQQRRKKSKHKNNKFSNKRVIDRKLLEDNKTGCILSVTNKDPTVAQPEPPENLRFSCEQCGRLFQWRSLLQRHTATAHVNCKLQCQHCAKAFKNNLGLRRHIKSMHEKKIISNSAPVQCPICLNMFKLKKTLLVHLKKIHTPDTGKEEERYCVECNKLFKSKQYYDLHLKSSLKHAAAAKYECHDCGKKFVLKGNLVVHLQRTHLNRRKHACGFCGKLFYKEHLRRLHEQHNHLGVPRERNHVCSLCGKAFTHSAVLKRHLVVHSGSKPHQCPHCPSRFTQRFTLTAHCRFKHEDAASTRLRSTEA